MRTASPSLAPPDANPQHVLPHASQRVSLRRSNAGRQETALDNRRLSVRNIHLGDAGTAERGRSETGAGRRRPCSAAELDAGVALQRFADRADVAVLEP